jgi:hypothetical protein
MGQRAGSNAADQPLELYLDWLSAKVVCGKKPETIPFLGGTEQKRTNEAMTIRYTLCLYFLFCFNMHQRVE